MRRRRRKNPSGLEVGLIVAGLAAAGGVAYLVIRQQSLAATGALTPPPIPPGGVSANSPIGSAKGGGFGMYGFGMYGAGPSSGLTNLRRR
jgi:hypothetical protein